MPAVASIEAQSTASTNGAELPSGFFEEAAASAASFPETAASQSGLPSGFFEAPGELAIHPTTIASTTFQQLEAHSLAGMPGSCSMRVGVLVWCFRCLIYAFCMAGNNSNAPQLGGEPGSRTLWFHVHALHGRAMIWAGLQAPVEKIKQSLSGSQQLAKHHWSQSRPRLADWRAACQGISSRCASTCI